MLLWQQRTVRSRLLLFVHFFVLSLLIHSVLLGWLCIMHAPYSVHDIFMCHPIHQIEQEIIFLPLQHARQLPHNELLIKKGTNMLSLLYAIKPAVALVDTQLSYYHADMAASHPMYVYATVGDIARYRQYRTLYSRIRQWQQLSTNGIGTGCTAIELDKDGTIKQFYSDYCLSGKLCDDTLKAVLCTTQWPAWARGTSLRLWW